RNNPIPISINTFAAAVAAQATDSSTSLQPVQPSPSTTPPPIITTTAAPATAPAGSPTPRTPRRESKEAVAPRRVSFKVPKNARAHGKGATGTAAGAPSPGHGGQAASGGAGAGPGGNPAASSGNGGGSGSDEAGGGSHSHHHAAAHGAHDRGQRSRSFRSKRWGTIRKEVIPNPAMMQVSEKVQHIIQTLRTPPEDRSENDIKLLYLWLMNQEKLSSLFTTMSEVSAKKLCKEMEFMHLKAGEVVVNQGDKGNTCFILVSGLVSVYVRNPEDQKKYQRAVRAAMEISSSRRVVDVEPVNYGSKVATLTPGATFGELCLIEPDSKRSATVLVDAQAESANFIVLTAASYMRMTRSQTIEGTITDHIAFLQHMLIFRKWTKMQLMHLVNSMKFVTVPAGVSDPQRLLRYHVAPLMLLDVFVLLQQYIAHKGGEAEAFFIVLRGEAQECVKLMVNETNEMSMGENRGVQHCITVELTFLGKFDVAGEFLALEKKIVNCPIDIRAVNDVDCLVLSRKLFQLHFSGKDIKKHSSRALKKLRAIAETRENWRETRINQALKYPNLRVPITRKLMRLSGNCCMICGRHTHIAGDELCMELAIYNMEDEKQKKRAKDSESRSMSRHRISFVATHAQLSASRLEAAKPRADELTTLKEGEDDDEEDDDDETPKGRLGSQLVAKQWRAAAKAGLQPPQPVDTRNSRILLLQGPQSITRSMYVAQKTKKKKQIEEEIKRIRESWPYEWHSGQENGDDDGEGLVRGVLPREPRRHSQTAKSSMRRTLESLGLPQVQVQPPLSSPSRVEEL
ncbi:TPA: hypothetical protein N0F65_005130, partial [Lagenidium giganteum]